jgi:hypothetical protein
LHRLLDGRQPLGRSDQCAADDRREPRTDRRRRIVRTPERGDRVAGGFLAQVDRTVIAEVPARLDELLPLLAEDKRSSPGITRCA